MIPLERVIATIQQRKTDIRIKNFEDGLKFLFLKSDLIWQVGKKRSHHRKHGFHTIKEGKYENGMEILNMLSMIT